MTSLHLSRWVVAATVAMASLWFNLPLAHADAPTLVQPPMTQSIAALDGVAQFVFSEAMDASGVDITWSGDGIDTDEVTCDWLTVPGIPLPSLILQCSYAGGWPEGVEVSWTLNPGGSGVIKSAANEALVEVSGSFTTPGEGGSGGNGSAPDCPAVDAAYAFPKRLFVCGDALPSWISASGYPADQGYFVSGLSLDGHQSLHSLMHLDDSGMSEWRVTSRDAEVQLFGGRTTNLFHAVAYSPGSSQLDFGVYDASMNAAPLYEKRLVTDSQFQTFFPLATGEAILFQDFEDRVELAEFNTNGSVKWARSYAITGMVGGVGFGSGASFDRLSSGYALQFIETETDFTDPDALPEHSITMARLNEQGVVQWAKRYPGFQSLIAPSILPMGDDGFMITVLETSLEQDSGSSLLVRLSATGAVVWSRRIPDALLHLGTLLPGGDMVFTSSPFAGFDDPENAKVTMVVIGNEGSIKRQMRFGTSMLDTAFVLEASDHFYLILQTTDPDSDETRSHIGKVDLQLNHFTWKRYANDSASGFILPMPSGAGFLVSAFHEASHELDLFTVNRELEANAECDLLEDVEIPTETSSLATEPVNVTAETGAVTSDVVSLILTEGSIAFKTFDVGEQALCEGSVGPGDPVKTTLTVVRVDASNVAVSFPTLDTQTYTIEHSTTLESGSWSGIGTLSGTNAAVERRYPFGGAGEFYRIRTRMR